jgi:hypothetical protein
VHTGTALQDVIQPKLEELSGAPCAKRTSENPRQASQIARRLAQRPYKFRIFRFAIPDERSRWFLSEESRQIWMFSYPDILSF